MPLEDVSAQLGLWGPSQAATKLDIGRTAIGAVWWSLMGDNAKVVVSHDLDRALVLGQRVIEGDFLLREPFLLAPLVRGGMSLASLISS